MRVSLLGSARHNFFTEGGRELFDCAAQGRIDAFFLGGAQIDGGANINLVGIGGYPQSEIRLAGSFGSSYLYFLVPRVILFKPEHTRRTLVERVDFVSAPGTSPPGTYRPGGPVALLTGRCVFGFDRDAAHFALATRHPDQTLQEISDNTAFEYETPERVPITREPDEETLALIRGDIRQELSRHLPPLRRTGALAGVQVALAPGEAGRRCARASLRDRPADVQGARAARGGRRARRGDTAERQAARRPRCAPHALRRGGCD